MFDFVIPVGCPNRVPFSTYKIHFQVSFSHLNCVIFHFLRTLLNIPAKFKLAQLKTFTAIGKFEGWLGVKTFIFSVYKCTVYQFYWAREVMNHLPKHEINTCHFIFQTESSIPMTVWTVAFLVSTVYTKKSTSPSKAAKV